ncbi:hypothetical protein GGS26DRAFT_40826 [Hypomontagnella submonticulosa]|nr:hypothetical protein GGS26DRAFT_40826 [Hypomontagnella submonticulosa]
MGKPKTYLTEETPLIFNGCVLTKKKNGDVHLHQKEQGKKIELVKVDDDDAAQQYIQQRARGAYIATICQPEATFDLSEAAQHKEPGKKEIIRLNKRLQWLMENLDRGLRYVPLDCKQFLDFD